MPARVRLTGGDRIGGYDNEGYDAQVDKYGAVHVRQTPHNFSNKTYEDTSFVTGDSPVVHDFNTDASRNASDGWIICDGDGEIQVDYSIDGLTYGDKFTMKKGEVVDLLSMNIDKIRVTWVSDSSYRIFLV